MSPFLENQLGIKSNVKSIESDPIGSTLGEENELITPHEEYLKLGQTVKQRQQTYRALFEDHVSDATLTAIRQATNKAWVLGSSHFKEKIAQQLNRRVSPSTKGGDRKSARYKEQCKINRV